MFPWNIAKSAEAILCRFALKRVCKFLLKKKLGKFILDIDLDQLDVQLSAGVLQLTDLALNVEYLNLKLGRASIIRVREGSIRSLLVKMPWNGKGCEVEVDELELVLEPCCDEILQKVAENHDLNKDCCMGQELGKDEDDIFSKSSVASVNVHEGVRTVAKLVKWLLTSFQIKIKNVIVVFDPCVQKFEEKEVSHQAMVLRITKIKCGTCISDDKGSTDGVNAEDFLGITHLTNFLKFRGVIVELLQMNGDYNSTFPASSQAADGSCSRPIAARPLLTGETSGFCGSLKLSIPWKNGSLDIRKVDAEVSVDPMTVILQLSTLNWMLATLAMLENHKKMMESLYHMAGESVFSASTSRCCSFALPSTMPSDENLITENVSSIDCGVPLRDETITDVLIEESHLISDWVPFLTGKCQHEAIEEADLGASVDQFFECFDGMRSSQSALGSSGLWGWTCSVFSAITAASNLASGSWNISAEQQHVQTNLKFTLAGVSTIFSFFDEDVLNQHDPADEKVNTDLNIRYLVSKWQDVLIVVQVYPQEWKLEATVERIDLSYYLCGKDDFTSFCLYDHEKGISGQTLMIRGLQEKVQSALPPCSMFAGTSNVEASDSSNILETLSSLFSEEGYARKSNTVKATLFQTSGVSHCEFVVRYSNGPFPRRTSFTLKLPPCILWLNFNLVIMIIDFSRKLGNSSGENEAGTNFSPEAFEEKLDSSACDVIQCSHHHITARPSEGSLRGNIFLPHARIILCFPVEGAGFGSYSSSDQFICLDFSSPPNSKTLTVEGCTLAQEKSSWKKDSPSASCSVHVNVANLDVYHITRAAGDDFGSSADLERQIFCADKILSLGNGIEWVCLISMLWHENAVTGAWIVQSAKRLATSADPASNMSSATSSYEFASVSTRKNREDVSSQKQEMILSSKFCLHVQLSAMAVTLCRSQYLSLFGLLNQVIDALSRSGNDVACDNRGRTVNQTSVLLECGPMEVQIELDVDERDCPKSSLQRELPGLWHKLRLEIQNLQFLSVSNLGAVSGSNFLWISHSEGKLWGSITTVADHDVLLISCSNSSNGRGDGEGSNVLSHGAAGSNFVRMWDSESFHSFMLINVKCGTIVAPGGRLDWLDKILSFFSLPYSVTGHAADCNSEKGNSQRASFVLKFVNGALCYEPYYSKSDVNGECPNMKYDCSVSHDQKPSDNYVACLLAASSLTLSNTTVEGSFDNDYNIRFQDVGLLICAVSKHENFITDYSVHHLRKLGFVKVSGEAVVDAMLKINCQDDISWELKCSGAHIVLSTCHDTTSGLLQLASQIQQLFAPDIEDSIVHLQNRWISNQQAQGSDDSKGKIETSVDSCPGISQVQELGPDSKGKAGLVGLMDEICEDAFVSRGKGLKSFDGSELNISVDINPHHEEPSSSFAFSENFLEVGHTPILQQAELIEGYCLSDLRSLSELKNNSYFPENVSKSKLVSRGNGVVQRGNCGWYGRTSLRILENYVPDRTDQTSSLPFMKGLESIKECDGSKSYRGRLLLTDVKVEWQMYAGSDWHVLEKTDQHSGNIRGRDRAVCLELVLSNMKIQYDLFPEGDICASKLHISVQDFHLYDKSRYAPWKLVLGYYHCKERPRESSSNAFKLDLEAVRPDPATPLEEYRLHMAFLPMLLHLHQSQLDFLIAFFGAKRSPVDQSQGGPRDSGLSDVIEKDNNSKGVGTSDEALLPFFQKFDIWPIIVRVDYRPSRVDLAALSGGKYVELVNLVPWKGVELHLKHVQAAGVYGWSCVCETTIGEWLEDISQNQIHKLLQGLPTIRSLVAVGSGAAKLVALPMKNYKKDHRLVKGLQRGTVAFLRSISVEALGLGVHLAAGAHEILLHAECILTCIQPSVPRPMRSKLKTNLKSDQPEDAQHGLQQAYESLSDGLGKSASALIHTPMKTYQRGGSAGSALVTVVRGAPAAAIAPASAAAQAIHSALLGVKNSLDPVRKEESMNKYLGPSHS